MKCPECGGAIPMPDLACDCPEPTTPVTCPDCWGHGQFHILANGRYTAEVAKCDSCDGDGVIEKETSS